MNRRQFNLGLLGGMAALSSPLALNAAETAWPNGPVRMIVPFAPGGAVDVVTRLLANTGTAQWGGQTMLVDNRSGGNTVIGVRALLNAPRDGHTLLVTVQDTLNIPSLMNDVPYTADDLVPVASLTNGQLVLVANPNVFPHDLNWLLHSAEAKKKQYAFASFGAGSDAHFLQYVLAEQSGVDIEHIPYRGSVPAITAVVAGDAAMTLTPIAPAIQFLKEGKLKPLAITGPQRRPAMPEVKTLSEFGIKGFDNYLWLGVLAAAGTPPDIIRAAHRQIRQVTAMPSFQENISSMETDVAMHNPAEFEAAVRRQTEQAKVLIQRSGIRLG